MDYIIKNATIIDGTGNKRFMGDVGIENGLIKAIGHVGERTGKVVIDATGLFMMPGAIDILNHSDTHWTLFEEPSQESLLRQGITTIIGGSCGASLAPLTSRGAIAAIQQWADVSRANINWHAMGEFLEELERHPLGVNFGTLVGHTTLRYNVLSDKAVAPDKNAVRRMQFLLGKALREGAFGISFGLAFSDGARIMADEIQRLAETSAAANKIVAFHMRDEGKNLITSINEVITVAHATDASVEIGHFKAIGRRAWEDFPNAIRMIRHARKEGLHITADFFPYTRTGSLLYTFLPEWAREGGREAILSRLRNPEERAKVVKGIAELTLHFDRTTIASTLHKSSLVGKTLEEAAHALNIPPEEAMVKLLAINNLAVAIFGNTLREEDLITLFHEPYTMISSDGIGKAYLGNMPFDNLVHPRSYGTIPRALQYAQAAHDVIGWEAVVKKMTAAPAAKLGLKDRGIVRNGYAADLVLFNPEDVRDNTTYDNPYQYPTGIEWVFLNGKAVIQHGDYRGALEGRVLRRSA